MMVGGEYDEKDIACLDDVCTAHRPDRVGG